MDEIKDKLLAVMFLQANGGRVSVMGYDSTAHNLDDYEIIGQGYANTIDVDFFLLTKAEHGRLMDERNIYVPGADDQVSEMVRKWSEERRDELDPSKFRAMFTGFKNNYPDSRWSGQIVCGTKDGRVVYASMAVNRDVIQSAKVVETAALNALENLAALLKEPHVNQPA